MIPCYRESERVPSFLETLCAQITEGELCVEVKLVDDGSGLDEILRLRRIVTQLKETYPFLCDVLTLENNRGKGGAIKAGWKGQASRYKFLAFVDADGAVSADEVMRLMKLAIKDGESLVIASRRTVDAKASRTFKRRFVAASFNFMVRVGYGLKIMDTQCGCKFLPADWYFANEECFKEEGFGIDLEILLRARMTKLNIREIGVQWKEEAGSKVSMHSCWELGKKVVFRTLGQD